MASTLPGFSTEDLAVISSTQFLHQQLSSNNLKAKYNSSTQKFTILHTSKMERGTLTEMILSPDVFSDYRGVYPIVSPQRSSKGNLEISFTIVDLTKKEKVSNTELAEMKKAISEGVIKAMKEFFNKHNGIKGIWHPNDYREYLMDGFGLEMLDSFQTGYANEVYFEKTDAYTFKVKEGRKASVALLKFLEGPTVADCANAVMACYYKAFLDIIGVEKFDEFFNKELSLVIGNKSIDCADSLLYFLADHEIDAAKKTEKGVLGKRPLEVGQECYFGGVKWNFLKHPPGSSNGWNVFYIGNNEEGHQLFVGHGFEKPVTESEINKKLVDSYNQERTQQELAFIAKSTKNQVFYDREKSPHLSDFYTLTYRDIIIAGDKVLGGFTPSTIKNLDAVELVRLNKKDDISVFKLLLLDSKISAISKASKIKVEEKSETKK